MFSTLKLRRADDATTQQKLDRILLNQEEILRRTTRIETRLVKLLLSTGLNEDGRVSQYQD